MRLLLIILISILLTACHQKIKLNDEERSWNPYKLTEILIFESSEGKLDTIIIKKISGNVYPSGINARIFHEQSLWVYARIWSSQHKRYLSPKILEISASTPNQPSEISFLLNFDNARFSGYGIKIKDLSQHSTMSLSTKAGIFDDVITIDPIFPPNRNNAVSKMYWSKENGYIKFEREDGLIWELIKKYVP